MTTPFHHRVKNTLTSVQAIAQPTLRNNKTPVGFVRVSGAASRWRVFPT